MDSDRYVRDFIRFIILYKTKKFVPRVKLAIYKKYKLNRVNAQSINAYSL